MSFFKELKEDIVQSVNELSDSLEESVADTDIEGGEEKSGALEREVQSELDSMLGNEDLLISMPASESEETDGAGESETDSGKDASQAESSEAAFGFGDLPTGSLGDLGGKDIQSDDKQEVSEMKDNSAESVQERNDVSDGGEMYNSEEVTVITKGTTINGGIKSDTSLIVKGVIEGDVECQGKLTITGRVAGNTIASEIYVNTPRLTGNLVSKGSVKVDVGTVVVGNISSASVVVAGAVKGDIDVNGPIIIDSTAVVQGSIIGKSVQINSGAVVDGMCSLKYADVDLDAFFE